MKTKLFSILWVSLAFLLAAQTGLSLNGKSVVRLKRAGVSDQTIQLIIKEKIIETAGTGYHRYEKSRFGRKNATNAD